MSKTEEMAQCCQENWANKHNCHHHATPNAIYGLGVVGALFYFLQGANGFMPVVTGIGKAIFWPAILMFQLLTYLKI